MSIYHGRHTKPNVLEAQGLEKLDLCEEKFVTTEV